MVTFILRQLGDDVVERLKPDASRNNRSLEGAARHVLKSAAEDAEAAKRASFLAMADRMRRTTEDRAYTPAEVLIREARGHGNRALRCGWSSMRARRASS